MCGIHTIYHLCGHVKVKTIVQCADMVDRLLTSNLPSASTHQVCKDSISDNLHVFPDICERCRKIGVVGDFMERPGAKLEIVKAWAHGKQKSSRPDEDTELSNENDEGVREEDGSDETSKLQTNEAILLEDNGSPTTTCAKSIPDTSTTRSRASSSTTNGPASDLAQIKMRIAALMTRTEHLLTKIRGQKPPTPG